MSTEPQSRSCLHLVVSAQAAALEACLQQFDSGDTLVLIDAGVMHVMSLEEAGVIPPVTPLMVSGEDLDARGLMPVARRLELEVIDDKGCAGLLRRHAHCLTWK
jgi:sulfur relay protein TusB/DsrH